MDISLKDKTAVICGSSQGIGFAAAKILASIGANCILIARDENKLKDALSHLSVSEGQEHSFQVADFSDTNSVKTAIENIVANQTVHILINNTGGPKSGPILSAATDQFEDAFRQHLVCNHILVNTVIGGMKGAGYGRIINIISTAGIKIVPFQGVYAGTKNAIRTIAEALRQESGGQYRVTGISPGFVKTELTDHILGHMKDEIAKAALKEKATKVAITPDAIANAVAYAINQPDHVDIGDIVIRPTVQD